MPQTNDKPEQLSVAQTSSVGAPASFLRRATLNAILYLACCLLSATTLAQGQTTPTPQATPQQQPTQQQPVGEVIDEDDVLRIDSNLVSIPAVVTESTGRAVPDLRAEDFELKIDGQVRPVGELQRADAPVVLAVLFDNSSSLSKAREFEKQAATRFFRRIVRPIDRAAIYSISTVPVLARPLTNNVGVLVRTIESFPEPEGATALFDTIAEAASYLRPQEARKVLVLVSDGNDTISEATFDQALQRALKADCQIYVVGTGDIENPNLTDTIARKRLQVLAAQTGGALYVPRAIEDLDAAFEQIYKDISQQYVISYYPTDDPANGRFRTIELRVKTRPTLRVRAREGYYAVTGGAQQQAAIARVRPRRANGDAHGNGSKARGADTNAQAASLDPLYTQPVTSLSRQTTDAGTTTSVSIRTKAPSNTSTRQPARQGPQEQFEQAEPERNAAPSSRISPEPQPARSTVEPSPAPTPAKFVSTLTAAPLASTSEPPARQTVSTNDTTTHTTPTQTSPAQPERITQPEPAATQPAAQPTPQPSTSAPPKETARASSAPATPISSGVLNGRAKTLPKPLYPSAARSSGIRGTVIIEVEIDEEGKVVHARVASGPVLLQGVSLQAARQARFSPTLLSGQPVRVKGTLVYNFVGEK